MLFIIGIHLHRCNITSLLTSCLFLSGFNASCECHHKTIFQSPCWQGRGKGGNRLRAIWESSTLSILLPETAQQMQLTGEAEAREKAACFLREHPCCNGAQMPQSYQPWGLTSTPLSRGKPSAAGGKAVKAPGRWEANINLAQTKWSTNSPLSLPTLIWLLGSIFLTFFGGERLDLTLFLSFNFALSGKCSRKAFSRPARWSPFNDSMTDCISNM